MIKAGLPTSRKRNLFLGGDEDSGILFQHSNTTLPNLASSDRAIAWEGTNLRRWSGSAWATISGSGSVDSSLDDSYDDGANVTVDGEAITWTGTHATNNVFELRLTGSGTGNMIDIENSSTGTAGYDIIGTSNSWSVDSAGTAVLVGITGCDDITAAANLTLEATGSGTITIGGTSTGNITVGGGGGTLTATTDFVITGAADTDVFTITDGDGLIDDGQLTITETDTATYALNITSSGTGGGGLKVTADALTSGSAIYIDSDNGASFSGDGGYINAMNGTSSVFKVGRYGAVTILGNAGSNVLTLTDGDFVITQGSITITADDDNAASLSLVNDTATTNDVVSFTGSGAFTGDSWMLVNPSGLTTGRAVEILCDALTQGEGLYITTSAITSGNAVYITNTGEAITSGELLTVLNNESGTIATITGNLVSFTSAIEEDAGTLTAEYDMALFSRTDKQSHASQYDAKGSTVKILKTHNKAAGTIVDAAVNLEIESVSSGSALILGDSVKVTSVGVNERSLNVINACTGKDSVLITASGALTDGLAGLHVTTSGDLATGGANLILTLSGSSCNAAARVFEIAAAKDVLGMYCSTATVTGDAYAFISTGATAAGKAVMAVEASGTAADDTSMVFEATYSGTATKESKVIVANGGGKDVCGVFVDCDPRYAADNDSAHLTLYGDEAGNYPIMIQMYHSDAGAADGEYCSQIYFFGSDDAPAKELYGSIEVEMDDTGAASADGIVWIKGDLAGTNTVSAGFTGNKVLLGAAATTVTTAGSWDLTISTNETTALEPKIVFTDGAAGNITITAGGTSGEIDFASPVLYSGTQSLSGAGAVDLTNSITEVTTTSTDALTLGDGVEGQLKFITMIADGGEGTLTPTNLAGYSTIKFNDIGDSCTLLFTNGTWCVVGQLGCTIA